MRAIPLDPQQLRETYNKTHSIVKTAQRFHCSTGPVHRQLRKYGISVFSPRPHKPPLELSRAILEESYNRTRSILKSAKELRCCPASVYKQLKRYGIPILRLGPWRQKEFPKERLEQLYATKSSIQIAQEHDLSPSGVIKWLKKHGIETRDKSQAQGLRFAGRPLPELDDDLWWMIGVLYGDGYCFQVNEKRRKFPQMRVGLHAKDRDFVERFATILRKVTGKSKTLQRIKRDGSWSITTGHHPLYQLKQELTLQKIQAILLNPRKTQWAACFLRGLFDSEGWIDNTFQYIGFSNTYLDLVNLTRQLMAVHWHIETGFRERHRDPNKYGFINGKPVISKLTQYELLIRKRASRQAFWKNIGFSIERKQRLNPLLTSNTQ